MLEWTAFAITVLCCIAAMVQSVFALIFCRYLVHSSVVTLPPQDCLEAAILLPLRGADARLEDTLRRLIHQDHPNFSVRVIVDNPTDPAFGVATRVAKEPGGERLRVSTIQQRRKTCGLQCSALIEAAEQLEDSVVDVVTIDGDVVAHPTWLRELVAPLRNPRVGASFGNRWFTPQDGEWGSTVRYLWNAAAIVPMWLFGIPWGGTFAIKKQWLIETGLLEQWKRAMVHDAPVAHLLRKRGLKVQFVPSLMIPIGEACELGFCFQFLKRQMLWTRLYHPNFAGVLFHAVATSVLALLIPVAIAWAIVVGKWTAAVWIAAGCLTYLIAMIVLLSWIDRSVMTVIQRREDEQPSYRRLSWLQLLVAIPVTQLVYTLATMAASRARSVRWRGVTYSMHAPFDVRLMEDDLRVDSALGQRVSL